MATSQLVDTDTIGDFYRSPAGKITSPWESSEGNNECPDHVFSCPGMPNSASLRSLLHFQGHRLVSVISFEPVDGFSSNLHQYTIVTSLRAD